MNQVDDGSIQRKDIPSVLGSFKAEILSFAPRSDYASGLTHSICPFCDRLGQNCVEWDSHHFALYCPDCEITYKWKLARDNLTRLNQYATGKHTCLYCGRIGGLQICNECLNAEGDYKAKMSCPRCGDEAHTSWIENSAGYGTYVWYCGCGATWDYLGTLAIPCCKE